MTDEEYEAFFEELVEKPVAIPTKSVEIGSKPIITKEDKFEIVPQFGSLSPSQLGEDKVREIVEQATDLVVESDAEARQALSIAITARRTGKEVSKLRKSITTPATEFRREAIKIEKEFTDQLSQVESDLLEKIEIYKAQRTADLEKHDIVDTSFEKMQDELGTFSEQVYYDFEIENFDEVPKEYLRLNEKKLNESIKNGLRNLPGIKIIEVKRSSIRLKGGKRKDILL